MSPMPPTRRRTTKWVFGAVVLATAIAAATVGRDHLRGAAFVVQSAQLHGWLETITAWQRTTFTERELTIPSRQHPVRARLYRPDRFIGRTLVLVAGVHAAGIDEPRLAGFARSLAAEGVAVVTPQLEDLARYAITARSTDTIEDAALWVAAQPALAPDGRVGMMGISFGGGLTVVAAGRPSLAGKAAFAFSFGGHGDLLRVLRYLCTGILPDGSYLAPHDYGVVIILLGVVDRIVPPAQVEGLRAGVLTFLNASHLDMVDKVRAAGEFERARGMEQTLPEPAATLLRHVNARDVKALGPRLLPFVEAYAAEPALSPERSPAPTAPVYLLHGAGDTVIPAQEAERVEAYLSPNTRVRRLVSSLITHAELDRTRSLTEVWRLVRFWTLLLDE